MLAWNRKVKEFSSRIRCSRCIPKCVGLKSSKLGERGYTRDNPFSAPRIIRTTASEGC